MNIIQKLAYNPITKAIQAVLPGGVSIAVQQGQSGLYTPKLTSVLNVAASTAYSTRFYQCGKVVHVSGKVDIDPTSASSVTQLRISLPMASDLTATDDLTGLGMIQGATLGEYPFISADTTNNEAVYQFNTASDVANRSHYFNFTYTLK